jgi:molybdate transport system ATP-binding protein
VGARGGGTAVVVMPVLAVAGLVRSYGGRRVVDVDYLEVGRGEVLAVLGPNGAGKSTLFRMLLLLERPDAGRILLNGTPIGSGGAAARHRMAGVFQRPHLFAGTVAANVAFGLRATGVPRTEWPDRTERTIEELGLGRFRTADVRTLSGGEAQRLALARALVLEPDVLLLDEPTAGLDVTVRRRFREELGRVIRERARSVVLITHDSADAFDLADRVAVMEAGRIVQDGTPEDLTSDPATAFVAAFTGAELLLDGVAHQVDNGTVVVRAGDAILLARCPNDRIAVGDPVHIRYRPEDVLLAPAGTEAAELSARNRLHLTVRSMSPVGGLVRVRLEGALSLAALLTRDSASRLSLRPGLPVTAMLKTAALNAYRSVEATSTGGILRP